MGGNQRARSVVPSCEHSDEAKDEWGCVSFYTGRHAVIGRSTDAILATQLPIHMGLYLDCDRSHDITM
ncbi:hypothetical protein HBI56_027040 [Parastagonospora nodorum]|uniref:Uncharacterized protein n=1 Tax=Phaeosphaeria nodorum (strain SN15 / ATCC MYA-4574 / FGSC 10173) TaxID=321614 RepID=A0A7U2EYA4_PHANO|nr:hypothetical protein HBH56_014690 [Parastagonospora nodorum]QRC94957.1 hypothetical protein JI435_406590 [Parastagonospora nodorum SN15]KAH3936831.1 hypothetical protein HBH54_019750 [Parastagonospora nodorum]KAH3953484.1 hypothetical protein HBH53_032150 [Parastagonospora nodorum]KAH3969311.1 hypothetical protein HBH51_124320 [Parastagonospora nodorum]